MMTMKRMQSCCCCRMMMDAAYAPRELNIHYIYTRKKPKDHEKISIYINFDYRIAS